MKFRTRPPPTSPRSTWPFITSGNTVFPCLWSLSARDCHRFPPFSLTPLVMQSASTITGELVYWMPPRQWTHWIGPALATAVSWDDAGLHLAVAATGGYPFFIQACGSHVWAAHTGGTVTLDDAEVGIGRAMRSNGGFMNLVGIERPPRRELS
jgi:hypothetical protein